MTQLPSTEELAKSRLLLDVSGPVATITLNRPESKNSQTPSMWRTLAAIGAGLPAEVRLAATTKDGRLPFVFEASGAETHFTNGYPPRRHWQEGEEGGSPPISRA